MDSEVLALTKRKKSPSEEVQCPMCQSYFPASSIESHADKCIERSEGDKHESNMPSRRRSPSGSPTFPSPASQAKKSRLDLSAWCGANGVSTSPSASSSSKTDDANTVSNVSKVGQKSKPSNSHAPLADQMRPSTLQEFVGQDQILGSQCLLRTLIESSDIPSMILWGPPGCGKTSLANVIASQCRSRQQGYRFVNMSATSSGVNDVKEAVKIAKNEQNLSRRKTILFIDEIHRFNKLQQDIFLPHVECGTITLLGATTENPSFSLNSALLSRCRVFVLEKLTAAQVETLLWRALERLETEVIEDGKDLALEPADLHQRKIAIERSSVSFLANLCDGDARAALNCLQLAVQSQKCPNGEVGSSRISLITSHQIKESLQRTHLLYDKTGEEHYNCISALHKSLRGDDADAGLYWLGRMLEGGEDPLYIARRLIRFASEDVGIADPSALVQAVAAYQACHFIGMPECEVILAQCCVYLARAPKSIAVYRAYGKVKESISSHQGPLPGVPLHLRNAPTRLMKDLGYGHDYKYNPKYSHPVKQDYLPECLKGVKFLD